MWDYNKTVMDHFLNPRNVGEIEKPDAVGEVGNLSCGDALKLTLKMDENERISDVKFQTFGCASAIASSSALTEIVKGLTIEEAAKVTNQDIVETLGELPEEKMHCSVMGMEALQAAIANYKGETIEDNDDDGALICKCFGVTDVKIKQVAKENNVHIAEEIKNYCKAGGACGSCLNDIQNILDALWNEATTSDVAELTPVQLIIKIQEVIEKEIRPTLQKDGGNIEFVNLINNIVQVKLQGKCATCPVSQVTLKNTVQARIQEFVSKKLMVEEVF